MSSINTILLVFFSALAFYFFFKEIQEILFLKATLKSIIGKPKINTIDDLVKLKNYLNKKISYNSEEKEKRRPLLRHTASDILKSGYGFCGENARVAIKLLLLGGVKARRFYLFRKEWQHVLVEHEWKGNWYMFDGHYDPNTLLKDEHITRIPSENILAFPDTYPNNPYLDFCRIKPLYKTAQSLSKIKLPSIIVYLLESPNIIKSITLLGLGTTTFCLIDLLP